MQLAKLCCVLGMLSGNGQFRSLQLSIEPFYHGLSTKDSTEFFLLFKAEGLRVTGWLPAAWSDPAEVGELQWQPSHKLLCARALSSVHLKGDTSVTKDSTCEISLKCLCTDCPRGLIWFG